MPSRTLERVLLLLLLLALARHVWLNAYVHPYADDFSYAAAGMRTELLPRLASEYQQWNGRYFTNILVLRGPITLGWENGLVVYRIVPLVLMALLWWSAADLVRALFGPAMRRMQAVIGGLFVLLAFLNAMPDASEGIHWYTGAVTYQLPGALTFFLAALWLRHFTGERCLAGVRLVWAVVLTVVIAGCNELHMAVLLLGHAALLLWRRKATGHWDRMVLLLFGVSLCCAIVVAAAPGNGVRGAHFPGRHALWTTLVGSAGQTARFLLEWEFTTALLPLGLLFMAWFRRWCAAHGTPAWCGMDRWWALGLPVAMVVVGMVLPYWSTGILGQYRTVNATLFLFLPLWAVAWCVWDAQVFQRVVPRFTLPAPALVLVAVFAVLVGWGRDGRVTGDLLSGRMARYSAAVMDRFALVHTAIGEGRSEVVLPALPEQPRSLVVLQPGADPGNWMNRNIAAYFGDEDLRVIATDGAGPAASAPAHR